MLSGKEAQMKVDKLQKRIVIILLTLCLLTPLGIILPMFFNAGDAWGEWSAKTVKDLIGYVPHGLAKYSDMWKAPLTGYTVNNGDTSIIHQSGYYIFAGIFGATMTFLVTLLITRIIVRKGE